MATRCSKCGTTLQDDRNEQREPCPNCGSTARTHEVAVAVEAHATVSASATVERGLNDTRLAVLGILVAIGLAVGFGVGGPWYVRFAAGIGALALAMTAIKWRVSRHRLMALMHWLIDK